jgi:hypothetical protein
MSPDKNVLEKRPRAAAELAALRIPFYTEYDRASQKLANAKVQVGTLSTLEKMLV